MMSFIDWLVFRRGMWRIWWGFCPECNSDAPELYSCRFCESYGGWRNKQARKDIRIKWLRKCGVPEFWI